MDEYYNSVRKKNCKRVHFNHLKIAEQSYIVCSCANTSGSELRQHQAFRFSQIGHNTKNWITQFEKIYHFTQYKRSFMMLHMITQATFWLQVAFQCIHTASGFNNTIALDLDETLVSSTKKPINVSWYDFQIQTATGWGGLQTIWVKKRQHVEQLLVNLAASYQVVVFTAAPQDYADQILNQLDQGGLISKRFYNTNMTKGCKDLSIVNVNLSKVLLVDDSSKNIASDQEDNAILIDAFDMSEGPQHYIQDIALLKLSKLLTEVLNPHANSMIQELKQNNITMGQLGFNQKIRTAPIEIGNWDPDMTAQRSILKRKRFTARNSQT